MKETLLNPNCSEATMIVDVGRLTEQEKRELRIEVEKLAKEEGEAYVSSEQVLGHSCMVIKGGAPYYAPDKIEKLFSKHGIHKKSISWLQP